MVLLYPFVDRPDVPYPVLFQAVPPDRPSVPPTRFCPRWFEAIDGWVRVPGMTGSGNPDIGRPKRTDWREWMQASGSYPVPALGPLEGTADEWARGVLYSDWIAGTHGPLTDCVQARFDAGFGDVETMSATLGKSEAGDAIFSDADQADADVETGGDVPSLFSDVEDMADVPGTGGGTPADFSDIETLEESVATGGDVPSEFADLDTADSTVATGGDAPALFSGVDTWDATGTASDPSGPGATCADAGEIALGTATTHSINPMENQWWKFAVVSGTTYRVRYVRNSGDSAQSASFQTGTCASLTSQGTLGASGCAQWTATYTGFAYIWCTGGFMSASSYTVTPDAGTCP